MKRERERERERKFLSVISRVYCSPLGKHEKLLFQRRKACEYKPPSVTALLAFSKVIFLCTNNSGGDMRNDIPALKVMT